MKTKTIVLLAALVLVVSVGSWRIACLGARTADAPQPSTPSLTVQPAAPVVVSPMANFDLEVSSPAVINEDQAVELQIEVPMPDLTWYDPHGLDDVGEIS